MSELVSNTARSCGEQQTISGMKLRHLAVLHRHGDRSPIIRTLAPSEAYWTAQLAPPPAAGMPAANPTDGDEGIGMPWGQLTRLGASQLHARGAELRELLLRRAPASFWWLAPTASVAVTSTAFPRTVHSTRALLSGLMLDTPGGLSAARAATAGTYVHGSGLTHTVGHDGWQHMIPDMWVTEEQRKAQAAVWARGAARARMAGAEEARLRLSELLVRVGILPPPPSGAAADEGVEWNLLHDCTHCTAAHGAAAGISPALVAALSHGGGGSAGYGGAAMLELEGDEYHTDDLAELHALAALAAAHNQWRWFTLQSDATVAHLSVGPFVEAYLAGLQQRGGVVGAPPLMQVYSAHDSTMASLMAALDLKSAVTREWIWPDYAAVLRAEVLEPSGGGADVARFFLNDEPMLVGVGSGEYLPELPAAELVPIWARQKAQRE